ncbi:hypothetical protein [Streptomyces benahoarensis]|uniref:Secreted protein n=1 Tax=Streptomyces benahoarensis TaxID=2595054 RepID=A0A553ZQF9_9ACTN|nr:hypothetical protein [Streptomyces benahoarensis]TSB32463.1 hypothetical protein FNJ62_01665 [Streptomyces benahoarensis]TSB43709.1 hypothetical protein FNZ23_02855 [Streptomyces benahoarensis]
MQPLAGQDLSHTQPRPMHWLTTATAVAAVIAAGSFVQPPDATATTASAKPGRTAPAPDAHAVTFPLDCGPNRLDVVKQVSGDLDGDGTTETVATVRCHSDTGTPPDGVYVLARTSDAKAAPRIVATLLDPSRKLSVQDLALHDGTVSATLLGYSTTDVPRCCPDVRTDTKWRWQDGKFLRTDDQAALGTARV